MVDLPAERRNVQILAAVAAHGDHVFLPQMQGAGQVYREGCVAAGMMEQPPPIAEHGGIMGDRPEGEQHGAAFPLLWGKELPAVAAQALIFVLIAVVVGQHLDGMGNAHRLQLQLALRAHQRRVELRGEQPAFVPIVVFHNRISVS